MDHVVIVNNKSDVAQKIRYFLLVIQSYRTLNYLEIIEYHRAVLCWRYLDMRNILDNKITDKLNAGPDNDHTTSENMKYNVATSDDRQVLKLMGDILIHVRDYWKDETNKQRRYLLHNLVQASSLLSREFVYHYKNKDDSRRFNLFKNIKFLVQCQIIPNDQLLPIGIQHHNEYALCDDECNLILWELCTTLIHGLLFHEVNATNLQITRDTFNEWHPQLAHLHAIVSIRREKFSVCRMLGAINLSLKLNLNKEDDRSAFIRQIQIIGEACNSQNISAKTKNKADGNLQIFLHLRNKLCHHEWDLARGHLNILFNCSFIIHQYEIRKNLVELRTMLQELLEFLEFLTSGGTSGVLKYYAPTIHEEWILRTKPRMEFHNFFFVSSK